MRSLLLFLATSIHCISYANVIGSDAQNFAPTPDGIDYVTVHSSETLEPGILNFGLFLNYAQNTFPAFEGSGSAPSQSLLDKNDSITSADVNFAIGVFKNFQIGVSLPYIIEQSIDSTQNLGRFEGSGTSEVRPSAKYKFYEAKKWGFASVLSTNFNRIDNNPYLGQDAGPTWNLEFIADRALGKWNWALNVGRRWRDPGTAFANTGIDPLPDQWIYSTGISYLFNQIDTKFIGEIYGSTPTEDTPNLSNRQNSSLEALVGAKHDLNHKLAVHLGFGTELDDGTSTPDWRIYAGINWGIGPLFSQTKKLQEKKVKEKTKITLPELHFKFNSDELTADSQSTVNLLITRISKLGKFRKITVEGHTDSVGPEDYNKDLSQRRAETISNILKKEFTKSKDQIQAIGLGESKPIADNGNFQGRQMNRRVEIHID